MVKDLIDGEFGLWKRDLIVSSFDLVEVNQIVIPPLSLRRNKGKIVWHYERSGEYSIRSAYHLNMQYKGAQSLGPSSIISQKLCKEI